MAEVLRPGIPIKTGARDLLCRHCDALLKVTRADVVREEAETTSEFRRGRPVFEPLFSVVCPECGRHITVESEMEN